MSVINQMLQDLEKRRASTSERVAMPNQVRPLPATPGAAGRPLLIGVGVAAFIMIGTAVWWWSKSLTAPPPMPQPKPASEPLAVKPPLTPEPSAVPADSSNASPVAKPAPDNATRSERNGLRLSPSLHMPPPAPDRSPTQAPGPAATGTADAPAMTQPAARGDSVPSPRANPATGSIDKRARPASPRERADIEYRRATTALNQHRTEEAEEALHAALAEDATHDAARQALAGMLVEQKRVDEAKKLLQEYLNSRPNHIGFAMLLARLQLDRGDSNGAIATMKRTQPYAADNADFLGFSAAILQRAGQHLEAAEEYRAALRLKPDTSVWWMGLGISLQASERGSDARDAYRRALSSGSLSPELQAFVEQRIKQLSP